MAKALRKNRVKQPALVVSAPQNRDECAAHINKIGRINREIIVTQAAMNDEIAAITERYTAAFTPLQEKVKVLMDGVQSWCEANRETLTEGGKYKSADFPTGMVQWRKNPPSVAIKGVDAVIETLKRLGLERFVRTKEEINKDAILNEKDAVKGVAGITIKQNIEEFIIQPFEQEAT